MMSRWKSVTARLSLLSGHPDAAAPLKVSAGSPALKITRINRDQHGRLIDCDLEFWRHDAIHVSVEVPE